MKKKYVAKKEHQQDKQNIKDYEEMKKAYIEKKGIKDDHLDET